MKFKFKNPYINKCLRILKENNVDIDIVSVEHNKVIKSIIINGSTRHIKRDIVKVAYKMWTKKEIYEFDCYEELYSFIKTVIDENSLYEKVFIRKYKSK